MFDIPDVQITVVSQEGRCDAGHKVGDQWIVDGKTLKTPEGMCIFAYQSLQNVLVALMFGASFPWEKDPDSTTVVCPDPGNPCVFELRRLGK